MLVEFCYIEAENKDASFVLAPRQRNSRDENNQIKEGKGSELWNDKPHKKCHKDVDARWTKKRGETEYGYKDHVVVCQKTKFVRDYEVTAANVHDSKVAVRLLKRTTKVGELAWEDAGYVGTEDELRANGIVPIVCEKGYRGHPLTEKQKENNRKKSSIRSRVEHVFGFMEQTMHGGLIFRGVGIMRAKANIAMTNLVYNMCRLGQVVRLHRDWITAN